MFLLVKEKLLFFSVPKINLIFYYQICVCASDIIECLKGRGPNSKNVIRPKNGLSMESIVVEAKIKCSNFRISPVNDKSLRPGSYDLHKKNISRNFFVF